MWSSKAYLERCERLKGIGLETHFVPGARIARGFADVGYEEYYCVSSSKILSIYTGHISALPDEHRDFFFPVPDADSLANEIVRRDWDIIGCEYVGQRSWKFILRKHAGDDEVVAQHESMLCALAEGLLVATGKSKQ